MPQACVTVAGLVFGVALATLYHHLHNRELARVVGAFHEEQSAVAPSQ
jgi:hypothetical protein